MYFKIGLWENSIMIVTADNGGETRDGGNNYPLRSQKWSLYEGGVRANAFVTGGLVNVSPGTKYRLSDLFIYRLFNKNKIAYKELKNTHFIVIYVRLYNTIIYNYID